MSEFLKRIVLYLKKNWNKVVLWSSILGAIIVYLIPPLRSQTDWFIAFCFMGALALIFTLLDIHDNLLKLPTHYRYKSMDAAEPQLVKEIVRRSHQVIKGRSLEVKIIGGRLRNIRRILVQLFTDVQNGNINLGPVSFTIYHIAPEMLESWSAPKGVDIEEFKRKNKLQADTIRANIEELCSWQARLANLTIKCVPYDSKPFFYSWIIGNSSLFWGPFTWVDERIEFQGPQNPCYFFPSSHEDFEYYASWFDNRTHVYDLWKKE